jgi:probable HAF family extracellular repeat protein
VDASSRAPVEPVGQVVGLSDTGSEVHAFLWERGAMIDLGTLPGGTKSVAYAVNNRGQVVGAGAGPSPSTIVARRLA